MKRRLTYRFPAIFRVRAFICQKESLYLQYIMSQMFIRLRQWLGKLSFRTGIIVAALCVICYIVSFAQMLLPMSATVKGVLWTVFFGLAKTFQYTAILILGTAGVTRVKAMFKWQK